MTAKIAICIPLKSNSRQEIASTLLERYGTDYLFLGRNFQETTTNQSCEIDILSTSNNSVNPSKAFELAGANQISSTTLKGITRSPQIVHLTSTNIGYQSCLTMARLTQVFLNIGGIAVNVESAEIACEREKWLLKYNSQDVFDIYSLYVGLVEGESNYYSCGMQNFGKPDVSIEIIEDIGLAIYVMNVFNYYRLTETSILKDGHTFQPDISSPRYQIKLIEDKEYEIDTLQHNPYGRWHLSHI